jgi:hypothetical protein
MIGVPYKAWRVGSDIRMTRQDHGDDSYRARRVWLLPTRVVGSRIADFETLDVNMIIEMIPSDGLVGVVVLMTTDSRFWVMSQRTGELLDSGNNPDLGALEGYRDW